MRFGKHTEVGQQIAKLEDTIRRKDREIYEVKQECASAFKEIYELSKGNSFSFFPTIIVSPWITMGRLTNIPSLASSSINSF